MEDVVQKKVLVAVAVFLVAAGAIYFLVIAGAKEVAAPDEQGKMIQTPLSTVMYQCDKEKTITVAYFEGAKMETPPGEMPAPTGIAQVSLDNGSAMSLHQTLSASGIRYGNKDESFVFWSKGDEALIMRNNQMDLGYTNCRAQG